MLEIERKILEINVSAVEARIKKLLPKPRKIFSGLVRVRYFDFSGGRVQRKKDLLRVREILPTRGLPYTELVYKTYKGVKKNAKYFDECEIKIADRPSRGEAKQLMPRRGGASFSGAFETLTELFCLLGLQPVVYYEKKRTLYRQGRVSFEIDEHPKIPAFLEIEAPSPREIDEAVRALGLQAHEQTAETISELLARKYAKIKLNGLRF